MIPDSEANFAHQKLTEQTAKQQAEKWGDKPDQFSERVKVAHPVICKDADRHARYALAMEMIHSRHSKYALVDLVNWLLTKWPELQSEAKR